MPQGVAVVTTNDIVIASLQGSQSIGDPIRRDFFRRTLAVESALTLYDAERRELRIATREGDGGFLDTIWRYSSDAQGWTRDEYPFDIRSLSIALGGKAGTTIGELAGTIGSLDVPIRDVGVGVTTPRSLMLVMGSAPFVAEETVAATSDVDLDGAEVTDNGGELWTGLLTAASPLEQTEVIELQLQYEAEAWVTVFYELSRDQGLSWEPWGQSTLQPTQGPRIVAFSKRVVGHNLQFKLRTNNLSRFTLIAFYPHVVAGPREIR